MWTKASYMTEEQEQRAMKRAREAKPLPPAPAKQDNSSDDATNFVIGYATGIPYGAAGLLGAAVGGHFSSSDNSSSSSNSDSSSSSGGSYD